MKRHIITGTPGAGKTCLIRFLESKGYGVVEESATDVIDLENALGVIEPWTNPEFIDKIVSLQRQRQITTSAVSKLQFFDRSPICTYALSVYLSMQPSQTLMAEVNRIKQEKIYQKKVFFIENLGFCKPSEARKISFEDSLRFEKIHEEVYKSNGFECIRIAPKSISERVNEILSLS